MKVQTIKGTNLAQQLFHAGANLTITHQDSALSASGKGSVISLNGEAMITSDHWEMEIHNDVTEVKHIETLDGDGKIVTASDYEYLKGTDIKVEDFVHDKYTYNGSAWGIA